MVANGVILALAVSAWVTVAGDLHAHTPTWWARFGIWMGMTAMMLPTAMPWVTALIALRPETAGRDAVLFTSTYGGVWTLYCAVAASAQHTLAGSIDEAGGVPPRLVGVVVALVGVYQFAPLKHACLRHCRSPFGALLTHWTRSWRWAVEVGLSHGLRCLGCCWALMALGLFAGTAHIRAMAVLTALVWMEQLTPWGHQIARVAGALLIGLGITLVW